MTHTLHRSGDETELSSDFVVFSMPAKGYNDRNIKERVNQNYKILHTCNAVNIGGYDSGVYTNEQDLEKALIALKEADLGVSIVVSGNFKDIFEVCKRLNIHPHTVEFSLGIFGKKELLPKEEILEITTMCGHGLISPSYVEDIIGRVRRGKVSAIKGAKELAKACYCGVFNPVRAARLIEKLSSQK